MPAKKWERGGPSPNPSGRPRGIKDKRSKISEQLLNATSEVVDRVITEAKSGDVQAASLIFTRVLPAVTSQQEKVDFPLDVSAPLAKQAEQVLNAVASGKISADVAKSIIDMISSLGSIRILDDFEERVVALENSKQ